jgi:predicted TPR repeat methyltransferase
VDSSSAVEPSASSGDLVADRRFAMALQLRARGDAAAAAEVMAQALDLAPYWAEGRFTLAETLALAGDTTGACESFRAYLVLDPEDSMGAAARLHVLAPGGAAPNLNPAYLRRLFDQYAPRFDQSLRDALGYVVPDLLVAALQAAAPGRRFARALDLGCGTGLCGAAVRTMVAHLSGVDLSPAMVAEATRKGVFDQLATSDLMAALADDARYDLILAGDVYCYVRDLAPVFAAVTRALDGGGLFAFTVERNPDPGGEVMLAPTQRFKHGAASVDRHIADAAFSTLNRASVTLRMEKGVPVDGLLYLLRKELNK